MICSFAAFFTDSFKIEREIFHVTELSCYRNRTGERILTPSILPLQLEAPCAWGGKSLGGSVSPRGMAALGLGPGRLGRQGNGMQLGFRD